MTAMAQGSPHSEMRILLWAAFTAFTTTAAAAANPNLKHLLFYTCLTKEVDNQCEEVGTGVPSFLVAIVCILH